MIRHQVKLVVPVWPPQPSTRRLYYRPEATYSHPRPDQTPGLPWSIHTDMDVAMEMGDLDMGSSSEARKVIPHMEAPPKQTGMLLAPDLVTSITKGTVAVATEIIERFACPPPVDDVAEAAIREHFQQRESRGPVAYTSWGRVLRPGVSF